MKKMKFEIQSLEDINKITYKQKEYIKELQEMSIYSLPTFTGTTKKEASEYIQRYEKMAYESAWAITKGY